MNKIANLTAEFFGEFIFTIEELEVRTCIDKLFEITLQYYYIEYL
jgi:hypothetical protein